MYIYIYIYMCTQEGKTALQLAEEEGKDEVVAVLTEHMACGGRK